MTKSFLANAELGTIWKNNPSILHNGFPDDNFSVRLILSHPYGTARISVGSSVDSVPLFACGFFCAGLTATCNAYIFSIFIVNAFSIGAVLYLESPQVVWSANHDRPVKENATVQLTELGDLVLYDADGTLVWSTNTTGKSVVGMNLTGSGNLVLLDHRNMEVWRSSDHPTNTLVTGQVLHLGQKLIATNTSAYIALKNGSLEVFTSFRGTDGPDYLIQFPMNAYGLEFVRLDWDGHLRLYQGGNGLPKRFCFESLKSATGDFSRRIGVGGSGSVFEGHIGDKQVAVKRLDGINQGEMEFLMEVQTVGSINHIHLVNLVGFCAEKSHRLLVYEYMPNGSLDKWIFVKHQVGPLDWKTRLKIITGVARGLAYLHSDCRQTIAHLDIKPQNILLDEMFAAKVSDFGLAKLIDREQSTIMTRLRGTLGYLAPEWLTSIITEKVDVYSFGIVIMEILCGRRNLDYSQPEESQHLISMLQEKAKGNQLMNLIDPRSTDMEFHIDEVLRTMNLAMWCLQVDSNRRPSMSMVVKILEGTMSVETELDLDLVNIDLMMANRTSNNTLG
ncbi:unnamed protein product [Miscanthus lutarioriparius]|uniref:non-specific serine/threonine protein kinase n=1 Tax=Miscanthus lutarioriparius TaxID=422564 RepID=A0A811S4X9_9POAL|nr:unnamed protein product [Miscanthus lutarioriparius]